MRNQSQLRPTAPITKRDSDYWQRTLADWGPPHTTTIGLAWRMYAIWPAMQALRLFAIASLTLAVAAWAARKGAGAVPAVAPFATVALLPVVPLLYLWFLDVFQAAAFTVGSGRALAVLPARNTTIRDAAWLVDVLAQPVIMYCVAILIMLVLPLPMRFKAWFTVALLLVTCILCGLRASSVIGGIKLAMPHIRTSDAALLTKIDTAVALAAFLSCFSMIIGHSIPWLAFAVAAIGSFAVIWSYLRMPLLASGKGGHPETRAHAARQFQSAWTEVLRIYYVAPVTTLLFTATFFAVSWKLRSDAAQQVPMMVMMACSSISFPLALRVRAGRVLPLSTGQLTLAVVAYGFLAALPISAYTFIAFCGKVDAVWWGPVAVAACLSVTAMAIAGVWLMPYRLAYLAVMMVVVFLGVFTSGMLHPASHEAVLLPAVAAGILLVGCSTGSVYRYFFWNSKVYRAVYQNPQQASAMVTSSKGDYLLLILFALIGVAALLFALAQLLWK